MNTNSFKPCFKYTKFIILITGNEKMNKNCFKFMAEKNFIVVKVENNLTWLKNKDAFGLHCFSNQSLLLEKSSSLDATSDLLCGLGQIS